MQRSGTEAIRTQNQPSKPKRETINITNSQYTKKNTWSTLLKSELFLKI